MKVIPIASGKGGVGKSLIAANLAIALAYTGKTVYLIDLDLGGSNLHLLLGMPTPKKGLGSFLANPAISFQEIIQPTEYKNLYFVPGDAELPGAANIAQSQKHRLARNLTNLEADYVIVDLGAGTGLATVDFFLLSHHGILVTTPTPTATVNAYLMLKNAVFRIMHYSFKRGSLAAEYLDNLKKDGTSLQRVYVPKILESIAEIDPVSHATFLKEISSFQPRLVLNMLENPPDAERAKQLRKSCQQYLGIDLEHLGIIYRDELQDVALKSKMPILKYKPQAVLSQAIYRIADKLLQTETEGDLPFDIESIEDTFAAADMEATVDFDAKLEYIEELLHCGALSMGDLIETIKTQQIEIQQLKRENQALKMKLVKMMGG